MSHIEHTKNLPKIAIIGRPNVGKSSLFNRIVKKRKAIIESVSGVTRDRLYAQASIDKREFIIVDTGGIVAKTKESIEQLVYKQSREAIKEADAVILLCDVKTGITEQDEHIASIIQKEKEKTFLVVNKVDNATLGNEVFGFYQLGFNKPYGISALHGSGLKELYRDISSFVDTYRERMKPTLRSDKADSKHSCINIAIVGKPNVGKSSFINCILDKERVLVDSVPGTTRDSIDITILRNDELLTLVDTAGMQHKKKLKDSVEVFSLSRSKESIRRSDVALIMIDATVGLMREDIAVIDYVIKEGTGCVLLVNKWDLLTDPDLDTYKRYLLNRYRPLEWIPIMLTSCKERKNIIKVLDLASVIKKRSELVIPTTSINKVLTRVQKTNPHPSSGRTRPKIFYATQTNVAPPQFLFFCKHPNLIRQEYMRFLERRIRDEFNLVGIPISFKLRQKSQQKDAKDPGY